MQQKDVPNCRVILPEEVGSKAVPSTAIVSCTVHEAIRRDLSSRGACRTEATLGKGMNLSEKDLIVFPCKPQ